VFIGFWSGDLKGTGHCEDLDICGRITLRWTLGKWEINGANWIQLAQDRVWCQAFVSIINLRVP
jgi:hypothetical protein